MKITTGRFGVTTAGIVLATVHSSAFGQTLFTIAYAPLASSVPTMSDWGMLALSVLVAAAAILALRNKGANGTVASIALACALSLGAFAGHNVVGDADAGTVCVMSAPGGGQVSCGSGGIVQNTSGVTQQIIHMSAIAAPTGSVPTPTLPVCTVGLVIPALGECSLPVSG